MSAFRIRLLAMALCAAISGAGFCATVTENYSNAQHSNFFDKKGEGWYWYIDPLPEPEPEPEKEQPQPPAQSAQSQTPPPAPFSLAWVKQMLPKYLETAWDNPTPQNVEAFFLVQRFAMDRANKVSDVAQSVVVGNTALDESMRRPFAMGAAVQTVRQMADKTIDLVKKVAEHAGIWFFYKTGCRFCEAQAPILGYLESDGFPILAISMDGGQLQSRQFPNTHIDGGHAAKLGVTSTPAVFLVSEDAHFDLLGMGVMSLSDLRQRILIVAARNGWITEEELKETLPIMNPNQQRDLGTELPKLLEAMANPAATIGSEQGSAALTQVAQTGTANSLADQTGFIDPGKLIELVNPQKNTGALNEQDREDLAF